MIIWHWDTIMHKCKSIRHNSESFFAVKFRQYGISGHLLFFLNDIYSHLTHNLSENMYLDLRHTYNRVSEHWVGLEYHSIAVNVHKMPKKAVTLAFLTMTQSEKSQAGFIRRFTGLVLIFFWLIWQVCWSEHTSYA